MTLRKMVLGVFVTAGILTLYTIEANAWPWRTAQLPNGNKYSCANCHVNPAGGGARNPFGTDVEARITPGGSDPFWGIGVAPTPPLAVLDSDQDTFTNGVELQDPDGSWTMGQNNPGDVNLVSNPGQAESTPPVPPSPTPTLTPVETPTETSTFTPSPTPTGVAPSPTPTSLADLNGDGKVDQTDLVIFRQQWHKGK